MNINILSHVSKIKTKLICFVKLGVIGVIVSSLAFSYVFSANKTTVTMQNTSKKDNSSLINPSVFLNNIVFL